MMYLMAFILMIPATAILLDTYLSMRMQEEIEYAVHEKTKRLEKDTAVLQAAVQRINNSCRLIIKDKLTEACQYYIACGEINYMARENIREIFRWYTTMVPDDVYISRLTVKALQLKTTKNIQLPTVSDNTMEIFEEFKTSKKKN